jgi:uncharacterized protein YjbI with pentapeptide repeats
VRQLAGRGVAAIWSVNRPRGALWGRIAAVVAGALVVLPGFHVRAGDRDRPSGKVTELIFKTPVGEADLSGQDLSSMDFAKLDFKAAKMSRANLFGNDLSGAKLIGVNLFGATLDRTIITHADFTGADLTGVSFLRPTVFTDLSINRTEAPKFDNAKLVGVRFTGIFDGTSFRNANLKYAQMGPHDTRMDISSFPHNFFRGCDFSNTLLYDADMYEVVATMANFRGADMRNTVLIRADLSGADFTGADLTGADFTEADLDGAILKDVKGLDKIKGLSLAKNLDRAIR